MSQMKECTPYSADSTKRTTQKNKQKSYGLEPAVRMQSDALQEHARSTRHKNAVEAEMIQRVSVFQVKLYERRSCNVEILYGGFTALYWLVKHGMAYRNFISILDMIRHIGFERLEHFQHQSNWSARGMVLIMAQFIKNNFLEEARRANAYGLMVDDVTDISVKEQNILFLQFYSVASGMVEIKFLNVADLLECESRANADCITSCITDELA